MAGLTVTYISKDSFSIVGNYTSIFHEGRRVVAYMGVDGVVYRTVESSSYAATITTMARILNKKTVLIYLIIIATSAFGAGFILNAIAPSKTVLMAHIHHHLISFWVKNTGAIVLLLILTNALFPKKNKTHNNTCTCKPKTSK